MIGLAFPQLATASITGGDWSTALPLANLVDRQITKVARSVDATLAKTKFIVDCGSAVSVQAFELRWTNLSTDAQWRIFGGTTSGDDDVYLGDWKDVYLSTPSGITGHDFAAIDVLSNAYTARYWTIEIDDESNADGYVEIGHLFMAPIWRPTYNASYGLQDAIIDLSEKDRADGGDQFFVTREKYRQVQFVLEALTGAESLTLRQMQRTLGTHGDLLYLPSTSDLVYSQEYGFLGTFEELSPIEYPYYRIRKLPMRITERL